VPSDVETKIFLESFLERVCPEIIRKFTPVKDDDPDSPPIDDGEKERLISTDSQVSQVSSALNEYTCKSTFDEYERDFLHTYSRFFDGRPRKLKRILNCYNVAKYIATRSRSQVNDVIFMQKLFVFTVLQEMWPYRTAWLLQLAERAERMTVSNNESVTHKQLRSMLNKINPQNEDSTMKFKDILLSKVYSKIIYGVMHSLPNSRKRMDTDANANDFWTMLGDLVLGDLYSDGLRPFSFNLPRSVMDEVSKYENDGIISFRPAVNEHDSWHAVYEKASSYYESTRPIPLQINTESIRPIPLPGNLAFLYTGA